MKIGCIFTAFNMEEYLADSLFPWTQARANHLDGHEFVIAAVSVPFEGFPDEGVDGTQSSLRVYEREGSIDWLLSHQTPMKETEARGAALKWLVEQARVDILVQVDSDEMFTQQDISAIIGFVQANPFITAFQLSLRNAVFTTDQYLAEPFTPMRIHRVVSGPWRAASFWDDNNVMYTDPSTGCNLRDVHFSTMIVPSTIAWIKHNSWINNMRSKKKISYQLDGRGWSA